MPTKRVFVTVGTTCFDKLISMMSQSEILDLLCSKGYTELVMQIGRGTVEPVSQHEHLKISWYKYKPSLKEDIEAADLVISHAGAGSCLETLGAKKRLLVVINEDLMNNHQIELASRLHRDGHLLYCTPSQLKNTLDTMSFENLVPFPPGNPKLLADFVDKLMGVS